MRGVLIDLDGVIWESDKVVRGAPAAIDWLNDQHIPYLFVTNTTSRPRRLIAGKLAELGIDADPETILTPPLAANAWLFRHTEQPAVLVVPEATREDFDAPTAGLDTQQEISAVIVGDIGTAWDYATMNKVFRLLMREPRPRLIALGMTRYWNSADGLRLDVAPFIRAFEHAAGCEALVLGKPSPDFFAIARARIGCDAIDTVMIGDDLMGDVFGAQEAGMQGVLVRTGKFRSADMETGVMPDALLNSIADLPEWWESLSDAYADLPRVSAARH